MLLQAVAMLIVALSLLWETPAMLAKDNVGFWLLAYTLPLMIPLIAYGVGRRRLVAH
ncbi:MAG: hypothetical protein QM758_27225 [Armatimonas sp.]